ncbi:MAG: ParB/RepB/Spo0J family partition protein [Clostridiales bacterium]|jgi:ParB family chromosome partitioning protein|nr:ParB/RepB/Spo0J family partition protein [Clostridiales bacterium]HQA47023.1 ParB/RepB/Spo0J family partition protein [Bacillota bacterium]HQD41934.1 ParB/RepB/Spo0J family partition protein [Bacillota bacterium]
MTESNSPVIELIEIDRIRPNPYQPRKRFNHIAIEELALSIKEYGVLQPIAVKRMNDGFFELIAGERRVKAAKLAGLKNIPAIVMEILDEDSTIIALIENLQREDLNFFEEAEGYASLMNDYGLTQEQVAKKVGKNQSTIANKIRLLRLPREVKDYIVQNGLTERHARALLKIPEKEIQMALVSRIVEKNLRVKDAEDLVERVLDKLSERKEDIPQEDINRNIRGAINYRIYVNTLKNAYRAIIQSGIQAEFSQRDSGEYIEVVVKIPKSKALSSG